MTLFLTYELKVAVLITVFYIFWRLLVAYETWHKLNRIVLLSTAVASFILPLCVITLHETVEIIPETTEKIENMIQVEMPDNLHHAPALINDLPQEATTPFNWQMLLSIVYIIGVVVVLSRMLLSLWRLHQMKQQSEIHSMGEGREIAVSEQVRQPFSWWKTVFLNRKDYEEGTTALLTHELGHIRLHHSADVLLVELLTALQWFNPTMWMLRNDLRIIHEYEADQQVLSHGFNDIQYLQLLIRKAASQGGYSLANGISNQSTLKKRVTMMMKPKSNHRQWLRFAYLLPIIAISLYVTAETKTEYISKEESAITLRVKDGEKSIGVKAPAGAFYTWLVNGRLAERGVVKEDGFWNNTSYHHTQYEAIILDGKEIHEDDIPYVPLSSIKEVKLIQGEQPRRIELYTSYVSDFIRTDKPKWNEEYKDNVKTWMFFRVEDAATGQQLKGAELTVEETGQKVYTNEEGWCEMKVPLNTTIKASYKGLESQTFKIDKINGEEVQGRAFMLSQSGDGHIYSYWDVKQEPEFSSDKNQWFAEHVQLSETSKKAGLYRVIVHAVINEDGSVSGARLSNGVRKDLNEEALRLVSSMPKWKPAMKDGKAVKCLHLIRVDFPEICEEEKTDIPQKDDSDSAVRIITEQHSSHKFIGYQIQMPIGAKYTWNEGKKGKGSEIINKTSAWRKFSVTAKTTIMMLNGKRFDSSHIPYIPINQIEEVIFNRENNKNPSYVNIITMKK